MQSSWFGKVQKGEPAPTVLIPAEIKLLLDNLEIRERTLVLLAASTGLRQSELFALKWGNIDFRQGTMNVTGSIACGRVVRCNTDASQKLVPYTRFLRERSLSGATAVAIVP
jgi:integrase